MKKEFITDCNSRNQLLDVWYEDTSKKVTNVLVEWFVEWEIRPEGIKTTNVVLIKLEIDGEAVDHRDISIIRDFDSGSIIPSVELYDKGDEDSPVLLTFK